MRFRITEYYTGFSVVHGNDRIMWAVECYPPCDGFMLISVSETMWHPLIPAYQANDYQDISEAVESYTLFTSLVLI